MLLSLVEEDLREGSSIESDSGSVSNDDGREEKFVENRGIDGGKSSAVGSGEFSILFNPSGLNASV